MYLTFDLVTKELLSSSDIFEYEKDTKGGHVPPANTFGLVYYNDYIAVENRPEIDFVETTYNETLQASELVPGQYTLKNDEIKFINLSKVMDNVLKDGQDILEKKIKDIIGPVPLSFTFYMGEPQITAFGDLFREDLYKIEAKMLGQTIESVRKSAMTKFQHVFREINLVQIHYKRFQQDVELASDIFHVNKALTTFIMTA